MDANGQSRPVTLEANRFNCYKNPLINRQVCGGDFETTVERSQWGITWGLTFGFEDKVRQPLSGDESARFRLGSAWG